VASAIQVFVRVFESPNREMQVPEIVFNIGKITSVSCLLEMKTCRSVLNQCAVKIILTIFRCGQSTKDQAVLSVKCPFEAVIVTVLNQWLSLVVKVHGVLKPPRAFFDYAGPISRIAFRSESSSPKRIKALAKLIRASSNAPSRQ
jgi:hypothetical protein